MTSPTPSWLEVARRRDVVRRALRVAVVVGTLLCLINHGDRLLAGSLGGRELLKIALSYLVPYAVSTYAAVGAIRAQQARAQRGASSSVGR
ncbi:MAG: nitrate/nitrite transporter NrtS [Planctomycetes bacterium]|nr:nitrate/nitrite transporter NrtS [Planctomycetota bacterium]